jgi:putative ABC transport system permease protein
VTGTLFKLAFAGIRSRRLASVLTVILAGAAAASIVLTLEVGSTAADPWAQTFEAADGAHVLANVTTESQARSIAARDGVVESGDPLPIVNTTMIVDGEEVRVLLVGLDGPPVVNKPVVTEGSGDVDDGVLFERSLAESLGITIGSEIAFPAAGGQVELPVVGTAVSPSQARYPRSNPGLAWVSQSTLERIVPDQSSWRWQQSVRLSNPQSAPAFAGAAMTTFPPGSVSIESWQDQRENALLDTQPMRIILGVYTLLMLIVSYSMIAILIGARVSSQRREIGLLKTIGLSPRQVSVVFVVEAAAVGFVGILIGSGAGALLAPRLASPTMATLVGSPSVQANPVHIVVATIAILPVVIFSAYGTARRGTRDAVADSLRGVTAVSISTSWMSKLLAFIRSPLTIELGFKDLVARRSRAKWLLLAIIITSAATVVTLSIQAALNERPPGEPSDVPAELPVLIYTLDAVLALVAATALMGVALLSVRERIRDFGVLRTIGLTPSQVSGSLVGAHAFLAALGSLLSIPIGAGLYLVLYQSASGERAPGVATWWWLAMVPAAMVAMTAIATIVPARLAARIPAAEAVRYE